MDGILVYRRSSQNVFCMFGNLDLYISTRSRSMKIFCIFVHTIFHNITQKTRSIRILVVRVFILYNETVRRMRIFKNLFLIAVSSQKKGTPWTENVVEVRVKFFNRCS
jgi:radical SAM superfamily enzyme with C-terminal helix-hairpin-helix motif